MKEKGREKKSRNPIDRNHMISRSRKISGLEKSKTVGEMMRENQDLIQATPTLYSYIPRR
jgi:hypothetical protein